MSFFFLTLISFPIERINIYYTNKVCYFYLNDRNHLYIHIYKYRCFYFCINLLCPLVLDTLTMPTAFPRITCAPFAANRASTTQTIRTSTRIETRKEVQLDVHLMQHGLRKAGQVLKVLIIRTTTRIVTSKSKHRIIFFSLFSVLFWFLVFKKSGNRFCLSLAISYATHYPRILLIWSAVNCIFRTFCTYLIIFNIFSFDVN